MKVRVPEAGEASAAVISGRPKMKVGLGDRSGGHRVQLSFLPHGEIQPFASLGGSG